MLTWNTFFDFSDSSDIDGGIKKIEQFESAYVKMIGTVEGSNSRIAGELGEVQSHAAALLDTVKKLNIGMEGADQAIADTAKSSEALVKEFAALKAVEAENGKQIAILTEQLEKLKAAKDKLKDSNKAEEGSYDDLKIRLAEAEKAYKSMGSTTSGAIKEEQLEKVRGLAAEFKTVNGALTDAKKAGNVAIGSYTELSNRVAAAKKQLREMEGGLKGNSQEFKNLQKFAKEGTDQLKEWDDAVGDNKRSVGDYAGEISKISPGFAGMIGNIQGATAASKAFIATPLGAVLLAIAAALGSLTSYFQGSIEGQDDLNSVMRTGGAIFETLKDVAEALGKALFEAISNPKKLWKEFVDLVTRTWDVIVDAFSHPIDTLKAFGEAIIEHVIKRIQGLGNIFTAVGKIIKSGFTDGFQDLADAAIQSLTGIEGGVDKLLKALEPLTDEMKRRIALGEQIAAVENKLRKDRIADIIDDAKTELDVTKLLVDAKDKLRFSDEQRFNFLRKANALLEEQLKGDLELARDEIKLQQLIIQQEGETYESRQKLVELQAKEIELQSAFFKARKKRQTEEIALIHEIEKETIDSQKRITDAVNAVNTVRLNDIISDNQKILAEENSSLEARLQAIQENDAAQMRLIEQDRDVQLAAIKEAGLARVELSAETLDAIYSNESISIQERIAQERKAKEELLATDEAYANETLKVQEDFTNKSNNLLDSSKKLAEDNVFKVLARDADIANAKIGTAANAALKQLNEDFANGDISSVKDFEQQKLAIQRQAQADSINDQIAYLKQKAQLLKDGSKERVQVEEKISQLELANSQNAANEKLKTQQALQSALKELQDTAFQAASDIAENLFAAAEEERAAKLEKLQEQMDNELTLAGDNEAAKIEVKNKYAAMQKKIEDEQAAAARKRAIFQKALAITEIAVNTAKGIGQALGSYPPPASFILAAIVGALGAIQIAAVASKPIPQFAKGTDDAPGGWAIVNELGPEAITDRKTGKTHIINTDGPTLAYVPQHAIVHTAEETARLREFDNYANNVNHLRQGVNTVIEVSQGEHQRELMDTINRRFMSLESTVKNKKEFHLNVTKTGVKLMMQNAQSTQEFLDQFYL